MYNLLLLVVFLSVTLAQTLHIVEQKSLVCFVDEVQFTISKGIKGKTIKTTNGKCSKIINDDRFLAFNYKNCDSKIVYLEPYGPLTKMDFIIEMANGETFEFGTQCFFDDTIGWSPNRDTNVTRDGVNYQFGLSSLIEVKGTLIDADLQSIKSSSLGEVVSFRIQVSDPNYKAMLPYDCKFSRSKDVDDRSDVHFVKYGCPIKLAGFMHELKRESSMSYIVTFNSFQIDQKRSLYVKCSTIILCTSVKNPKCNSLCYSNNNLTTSSLNKTTKLSFIDFQQKQNSNGDIGDKIVWFRDSFEVTTCANVVNNNGVILTLILINIILILALIFGTFMFIRTKRNQRKMFKCGQVSRSIGVCAYR